MPEVSRRVWPLWLHHEKLVEAEVGKPLPSLLEHGDSPVAILDKGDLYAIFTADDAVTLQPVFAGQIGAVLSAPDGPDGLTTAIDPANAGARGVAGLLQTLDYFASIERFFDSLYRLTDRQESQLSSAKTTDGPSTRPLSVAAVRHFERRFVACQGWRINLREPQVLRRFVTLLGFAADLIGEELVVDHGRVVRRMADERVVSVDIEGEARDFRLLETFDPRTAIAQWRREALAQIDDWVRRLKLTEERGAPPALTTTVESAFTSPALPSVFFGKKTEWAGLTLSNGHGRVREKTLRHASRPPCGRGPER